MNGQVLVGMVQSLRHAKALLCLHLTANPGISDKVEQFYRERLSVRAYEDTINIDIENEDIEAVSDERLEEMSKDEREELKAKLAVLNFQKIEEVCRYTNNKRLRPLLSR